MNRRLLHITLLFVALSMLSACSDTNNGYREYYHPMGNNPVQVIKWLKGVQRSFRGNEARISHYELYGMEYYVAEQFIQGENGFLKNPYTIYEANDNLATVYFHTDDALASDQGVAYVEFIERASFLNVLWSNESKYSSAMD